MDLIYGRSLATAPLHFVLLDAIHMILEMLFQPFIVLANKQSFERVLPFSSTKSRMS